jgi:ATP-binding cassette subfamily B protein
MKLPNGYDTQVGERRVKLSRGERQRIVLVRVLLQNTPILILDEPTSSVDKESEYEIQSALKRVRENRTTIIIAYRESTIKDADMVFVIEEGKIRELVN